MIYTEWLEPIGTSTWYYPRALATDISGNVYIAADTHDETSIYSGGTSYEDTDTWVAKYNSEGNLLWSRQIGTHNNDRPWGIATDVNDDIYISGSTEGSLDNNPNAGGTDAWLAKYDTQGNLLWTRQLGTSGDDSSNGVATDVNGDIYISGSTESSLDSNPNAVSADAWLAKYDTQGNLLWTRQLGTSSNDYASSNGVATDVNGDIYIYGNTTGTLDANPNARPGGSLFAINDVWVAKYDTQGNLLWIRQFDFGALSNNRPYNDFPNGLEIDNSRNIYIAGSSYRFDNELNPFGIYEDAWVVKYDTQGNLLWNKQLWNKQFANSPRDTVSGLSKDIKGNIYISGSKGGIDGTYITEPSNAWLAKYDTQGNLLWNKEFATPNIDDAFSGVAIDKHENIYISGSSFPYGAQED